MKGVRPLSSPGEIRESEQGAMSRVQWFRAPEITSLYNEEFRTSSMRNPWEVAIAAVLESSGEENSQQYVASPR